MVKSAFRFFMLLIALYGAYKGLMDFLNTKEGQKLKENVVEKTETAKGTFHDYLEKAKEYL